MQHRNIKNNFNYQSTPTGQLVHPNHAFLAVPQCSLLPLQQPALSVMNKQAGTNSHSVPPCQMPPTTQIPCNAEITSRGSDSKPIYENNNIFQSKDGEAMGDETIPELYLESSIPKNNRIKKNKKLKPKGKISHNVTVC